MFLLLIKAALFFRDQLLLSDSVGPSVIIDHVVGFSVGSNSEIQANVGDVALELSVPLVISKPEVGLVAQVVIHASHFEAAEIVSELNGSVGLPE